MPKGKPTKSRYRLKQEAGLVPCRYDRDSVKFNQGAWRHWPENRQSRLAIGMEKTDRELLRIAREVRGCVSWPQ